MLLLREIVAIIHSQKYLCRLRKIPYIANDYFKSLPNPETTTFEHA